MKMIIYRVLQLLFLISTMTSHALIKGMVAEKKEIEGIAQKIEELPKELRYKIFSLALALLGNPKYEVYKKLDVGSEVRGVALNADNTRALTGSVDGLVRLWDVEKGIVLKVLQGHKQGISSVTLSADGALALIGSCDGMIRVWNMNTEELVKALQVSSSVNSMTFSADGTLALTGNLDRIARLYDTSTGKLLKALQADSIVFSVALSTDGTLALTGNLDSIARLYNASTGELLKVFQVGFPVYSVALSADGSSALTVTGSSKVLVWDTKTGALLNTLLSDSPYIHSVALSKDGEKALVGTHEGSVEVWNMKPLPEKDETSTSLATLAGHTKPVKVVAFGGCDFIVSGSMDKTALIWKPFALEQHYWPLKEGQVDWSAFADQEKASWKTYKEIFSRPKFLFPDEK